MQLFPAARQRKLPCQVGSQFNQNAIVADARIVIYSLMMRFRFRDRCLGHTRARIIFGRKYAARNQLKNFRRPMFTASLSEASIIC